MIVISVFYAWIKWLQCPSRQICNKKAKNATKENLYSIFILYLNAYNAKKRKFDQKIFKKKNFRKRSTDQPNRIDNSIIVMPWWLSSLIFIRHYLPESNHHCKFAWQTNERLSVISNKGNENRQVFASALLMKISFS